MEKDREVDEMSKKVMKKLKEEVDKEVLKIVSHGKWEKWEGRKEQDDCVVWLLGRRVCQCSKEGVTVADSVETLVLDLRTTRSLGAKEKGR